MGGAQKSMLHPYEDLDLSLRELFTITKSFAKGGTFQEKVDGCNLTWRFDGDTFFLARNYTHFRAGGITIDDYRSHLVGHPAEGQFTRALDRLEKLRNVLKVTDFHKDYDNGVWINMEVIDKSEPQMLRYDVDCFVIHNLCRFVEEPKPHTEIVQPKVLSLNRFANILCLSGVRVMHGLTVTVPPMCSTIYRAFQVGILDSMMQLSLGLDNTLRDWVQKSIEESLTMYNVSYEDAVLLAENVSGKGKHALKAIRAKYDENTQEDINNLCLSANRIKSRNRCLEQIRQNWLHFGALRLEGVKSALIDDKDRAVTRIDDMIDFNVGVVNEKREKNESIYHGFHAQLETFVNFDTEPQIIEGFVFETDRFIVKLTGAFQSLNRICGTARYQFGQEFPEMTE